MYLIYLALWIIFNGQITLEIVCFGLVIAAAIMAFSIKFGGYSIKKEKMIYRKFWKLICYVAVLIKEIVKANFATIHMILSYEEENEPALVRFKTDLKSDTAKAFLANSITLTPGTITVSLEQNEYLIHALDIDFAKGMDQSVFVDKLRELEKVEETK